MPKLTTFIAAAFFECMAFVNSPALKSIIFSNDINSIVLMREIFDDHPEFSITVGADVDFGGAPYNPGNLFNSFHETYINEEMAAGTYTRKDDDTWKLEVVRVK